MFPKGRQAGRAGRQAGRQGRQGRQAGRHGITELDMKECTYACMHAHFHSSRLIPYNSKESYSFVPNDIGRWKSSPVTFPFPFTFTTSPPSLPPEALVIGNEITGTIFIFFNASPLRVSPPPTSHPQEGEGRRKAICLLPAVCSLSWLRL